MSCWLKRWRWRWFAENTQKPEPLLGTDPDALAAPARQEREKALTEINELCQEAVEISFNALAQGSRLPTTLASHSGDCRRSGPRIGSSSSAGNRWFRNWSRS